MSNFPFYLNKGDRHFLLGVVVVALAALAVIAVTGGRDDGDKAGKGILAAVATAESDSVEAASTVNGDNTSLPSVAKKERFPFDPNTVDSTDMRRLGLQEWQVRNIYKYRAAGGIYRSKEDFARLYGLTVKEYRELEPYIVISSDYLPASTLFPDRKQSRPSGAVPPSADSIRPLRYPVKISEGETIDLATADTSMLQRVPGIGPYYARRIADYGRRLGGFVSVDQLDEIEGFPQQAKAFLVIGEANVNKLNVNALGVNDLKRHPYINYYQARAICEYRRQHGRITTLYDLSLLPDFTDDDIRRITPYVEY